MADPMDIPKYRNAPHAAYTIIREEGVRALYKGVTLTALRQGISNISCRIITHSPQVVCSYQSSSQLYSLPRI